MTPLGVAGSDPGPVRALGEGLGWLWGFRFWGLGSNSWAVDPLR